MYDFFLDRISREIAKIKHIFDVDLFSCFFIDAAVVGIDNFYHLLFRAIAKLSDREQTIVNLRYGLNSCDGKEKTQKEVADILGISQSYISRLEKKIMKRLKREMIRYEQ